MLLIREDLWYVVEDPQPLPVTSKWSTDDKKARATMGLCIDDNQYSLVKGATNAKDFWKALRDYHEKVTVTSRVSLLRKLCNLNLVEGGDMEAHLFEVEELFSRLESADLKLEQPMKIAMMLRSLPDSYGGLVTALESRSDKDLTTELVKSKLLDENERRKERGGGSSHERVMKSDVNSVNSVAEKVCFFCKKKGHLRRNCWLLQAKKEPKEKEKSQHKAKQASAECTSAMLFMAGEKHSCDWVIDSGATAHMSNDRKWFHSLDETATPDVLLADGSTVKAAGRGSVIVFGVDGSGGKTEITLGEVLYVPLLSSSLVSVPKLTAKGLKVIFAKNNCDICDDSGKVVARGFLRGCVYHLQVSDVARKVSSAQHNELCQHQWHRRFGHRDPTVVQKMCKEKLADGVKVKDCGIRLTCEVCLEGKLPRTAIPKTAERKSTQVLDLVHTDLCGPMRTTTPGGKRFLMTVIDDYSRYTVVYLLSKKSEAADRLMEYVRYVENFFGRKPRIVRSDGGGEYVNARLQKFFAAEGIKAQYTTAYTPQQNGVAERRNRYLQEMATAMLLDAKLDHRFWGEAVLTAAYLQNRLPSKSVDVTPYEKWHGRKPRLDHLRVYGSSAWIHIPSVKRGKFDGKAQKLVFIGYSDQHKAYRFVDLATQKVIISRDARFLEMGKSDDRASGKGVLDEEDGIPFTPARQLEGRTDPVPGEECEESNDEDFGECEEYLAEEPETVEDPLAIKNETMSDNDNPMYDNDDSMSDDDNLKSVSEMREKRKNRGKMPNRYSDFVVGTATQMVKEPVSYNEAVNCAERDSWRQAMEDEIRSHERNGTWELTDLPAGRKVVGSRWVFKVKQNEAGEVSRFKARLVAQGHVQKFGIDYDEIFAPVTRYSTLRTLLVISGRDRLVLKHLDIRTAYLYGEIEEEVYMRQPPGYAVRGQEKKVCRLRKSIYGLKQSARCWNKKLSSVLKAMGFTASSTDPCLYIATRNGRKVYLLVYVDDLLVGCAVEEEITRVYEELKNHFEVNWLGDPKFFLGLEIRRDKDGVFSLGVQQYIHKLIRSLGLENAKVARTPMDVGYLKLEEKGEEFTDNMKYRSAVGALMYIATCARPDIATSASILGRSFEAPRESDWTAAKRVVRYLKGTADWRLRLGGDAAGKLEAFSDSDWAGDPRTRKSMTGYVLFFGGGAVTWTSRRQDCVSLSSMEAEYVALGEACQEVMWTRRLLQDLGERQTDATLVHEDNQGCLSFVQSERTSKRSKHIETKQCFIRDLVERGVVSLKYCPTEVMKADILTKPLGAVKHNRFAEHLGLVADRGPYVEEEC